MPFNWSLLVPITFFCLPGTAQQLQRFTYEAPKMGTPFRIVLYAADSSRAAEAVQEAFHRVDELNQIMSDYDSGSEINQLSDKAASEPARFFPVSPDLWNVLLFARKVSRKSNGAFDVTIGPLSRLWRRSFRRQTFPDAAEIVSARALVDYRQLKLNAGEQSVRLKRPGMRLDLGGIAKGYAVDAAYLVLKHYGFERALVDGGGDIYAGAPPPGELGWKIAGKVWRDGKIDDEILYLQNGAVATSGDTYRFLEWRGLRYSHLIDPRTGLGKTDRRLVTVAAPDCIRADALASTLSVISLGKVKKIARRLGVSFRIIVRSDTSAWRQIVYRLPGESAENSAFRPADLYKK